MKTDLVYILGNGSQCNDDELRYSLRSVVRHVKFAGKVFIVGRCPGFVDRDKLVHIHADDDKGQKLKNALAKILIACHDRRVSDPFILMNDDFLFLKDIDEIPVYDLGPLANMYQDHKSKRGYYFRAIKDTLALLRLLGVPAPLNYEVHYPMPIVKADFIDIAKRAAAVDVPYLFRSVYGNLVGLASTERDDPKVYACEHLPLYACGDFLSTDNPVATRMEYQEWVRKLFHKPSKFETGSWQRWCAITHCMIGGRQYNPGELVDPGDPHVQAAIKIGGMVAPVRNVDKTV